MAIHKNIPHYLLAILIAFLLKFVYKLTDTSDLFFILKPTDTLIGIIANSESRFVSEHGYFHEKFNIVIDKSCSGFNFWILCFLMLSFLTANYFKRPIQKALSIPIILFASLLLTIGVNTSRILFSIFFHPYESALIENKYFWLHQAQGAFIYLFFLITIYLLSDFLLNKFKSSYEKSAES